jgi:hypothetical protein
VGSHARSFSIKGRKSVSPLDFVMARQGLIGAQRHVFRGEKQLRRGSRSGPLGPRRVDIAEAAPLGKRVSAEAAPLGKRLSAEAAPLGKRLSAEAAPPGKRVSAEAARPGVTLPTRPPGSGARLTQPGVQVDVAAAPRSAATPWIAAGDARSPTFLPGNGSSREIAHPLAGKR